MWQCSRLPQCGLNELQQHVHSISNLLKVPLSPALAFSRLSIMPVHHHHRRGFSFSFSALYSTYSQSSNSAHACIKRIKHYETPVEKSMPSFTPCGDLLNTEAPGIQAFLFTRGESGFDDIGMSIWILFDLLNMLIIALEMQRSELFRKHHLQLRDFRIFNTVENKTSWIIRDTCMLLNVGVISLFHIYHQTLHTNNLFIAN